MPCREDGYYEKKNPDPKARIHSNRTLLVHQLGTSGSLIKPVPEYSIAPLSPPAADRSCLEDDTRRHSEISLCKPFKAAQNVIR